MKSLKTKLFTTIFLVVVTAVLAATVIAEFIGYLTLLRSMQNEVKNEAGLVVSAMNTEGDSYLTEAVGSATSSRITLIDTDGTVLYDSYEKDVSKLENHAARTEVAAAMKNGTGETTRHSVTLGKTTYYYAIRLNNGKILRIAGTINSVVVSFMNGFFWIALFTAILLAAVFWITNRMTKKIVRPINSIDLEHPMCNEVYQEMQPLLDRVEDQNKTIRAQMAAISRSREEYLSITENMQDGLIITNTKTVLSMNRAAMHFFHIRLTDVEGKSIIAVSREPEMKEAWDTAVSGGHFDGSFSSEGKDYELLGNPVLIDGSIHGAVLMILDVTEKQQTERMRREFTANVSHELKTPLMSISGYAELIETGMAKQKDIPEFAAKIRSESARLTSLVEDIIRLSEMDELNSAGDEPCDLYAISQEAMDSLNFTAHRLKINLSLSGENEVIKGSRKMLYEMIRNLIDNGIKYNRPGGYVKIAVGQDSGFPVLTVSDSGIGIPAEDTDRIFERFYRVDKSHSRATGGTGLGLSIVKHAALLHGGTVGVDSQIGRGTVMTVQFKKAQT